MFIHHLPYRSFSPIVSSAQPQRSLLRFLSDYSFEVTVAFEILPMSDQVSDNSIVYTQEMIKITRLLSRLEFAGVTVCCRFSFVVVCNPEHPERVVG